MYHYKDIKNYNPPLQPHQVYFILRWGELLDYSALHYRKLFQPCLRAVLREAKQVIEHFKSEVLFENNVIEIIEEVVSTIKLNLILKDSYIKDFSLVLHHLESFLAQRSMFKSFEDKTAKNRMLQLPFTLIVTLYNKIENDDLPTKYVTFLNKELAAGTSFEKIDCYLNLFLSELLYEGHHKQYLYNKGRGVFLNDTEPNFLKRVDRLSQLGKKNKRYFECFFKINLPDGYDSIYHVVTGELSFFKDPEAARIQLGDDSELSEVHEKNVLDYFKTEKSIARVSLNSTDEFSAISNAREKLISTAKLFTLDNKHKYYNPGNLGEALVYDESPNKIIINPSIDFKPYGLQISQNEKYIKINLASKSTGQYQGLDQILQWCRVVQDSPRETGLVALWSMMEYLFVTDNSSKRQNIIENGIPYIGQFFLKSITYRCREILEKDIHVYKAFIEETKKALGDKAIDLTKKQIKLPYLLQVINEQKVLADKIFDGKILELRYIGLINKYLQKRGQKAWFLEYLENFEKQVKKDLYRAYRIRNLLAHQTTVDEISFDDTYEKMIFYLKLILDDLLFSITLQPDHTVHQIVQVKRESYKIYKSYLKDISRDIPYKELLKTTSLLV